MDLDQVMISFFRLNQPNPYAEALTLNVMVFGDGAFCELIRFVCIWRVGSPSPSFSPPCEDTSRRQLFESQEEGSYQNANMLVP